MPKKVHVLAGQLELFPGWQEHCPLCDTAGDLATCRRLYNTLRSCLRCAAGLRAYGWRVVGDAL
jgi:hypothetical protein